MVKRNTKIISSLIISIIYLFTFLVVYFIFPFFTFSDTGIKVLIADITATVVIFIFSIIFANSSVYDPFWSVAPPVIVIFLINYFPNGDAFRQFILIALVLFWAIRLTANWFRGWKGLDHQDWRYTLIAEKTGKWYWPVSFLGIHLMPTLFVFLACLPLWYTISSPSPLNVYDIFAAIFTVFAILTEWLADEQLMRFRKNKTESTFIRSGIWKYTRHPNYLGEISFWGGMFLFVISSTGLKRFTGYWTVIGLVSMIILFKYISIPLMEKRNKTRKPGYTEYIEQVPALIPHFFIKVRK